MLSACRTRLLGSNKGGIHLSSSASGVLPGARQTSSIGCFSASRFLRIDARWTLVQFSCLITQILAQQEGKLTRSQGQVAAAVREQATCPIFQSNHYSRHPFGIKSRAIPQTVTASKQTSFKVMAAEGSEAPPEEPAPSVASGQGLAADSGSSPARGMAREEVDEGTVPVKHENSEQKIDNSPAAERKAGRPAGGRACAIFRGPSNSASEAGGAQGLDGEGPRGNAGPEAEERGSGSHRFKLTDSCTLVLGQGDITEWTINGRTDAIVNAANERMLGGGGVDGAIHRAAGRELHALCLQVPEVRHRVRCPTGEARATGAGQLPVKYVIHAVGPIYYRRTKDQVEQLLYNAYKNSMGEANRLDVEYICFPAISCGVFGYPYDEAAGIALKAVQENAGSVKEVHFLLFEDAVWEQWLTAARHAFEHLPTVGRYSAVEVKPAVDELLSK